MVVEAKPNRNSNALLEFAAVFVVVSLVGLATAWTQFDDPFLRHDDHPALFGDEDWYFPLTLTEGRWLNYLWVSRPFLWSSQGNYIIYLVGWALFSAAFAQNALGARAGESRYFTVVLGALIFLTPQAFNIAQWYNTTIPAVWVMAVFSVCNLIFSRSICIYLMLLFVPLAYSSYNSFPFLVLAILLTSHNAERNVRDFAFVCVVFGISLALAMVGVNLLNWIFHGTYSIEVAGWRNSNQIRNFDDFLENTKLVLIFLLSLLRNYGVDTGRLWSGYFIFSVSLVSFLFLLKRDRWEALYVASPAVIGMGLLAFYCLVNGVLLPVRATIFLWVCSSYALVRSAILLGGHGIRRLLFGGLLLCLCAYLGYQQARLYQIFDEWQNSSRDIVDQISPSVGRVYVYGDVWRIRAAGDVGIQTNNGFAYRVQNLTGAMTVMCKEEPNECQGFSPPFDETPRFGSVLVENTDNVAFIRLPAWDLAP